MITITTTREPFNTLKMQAYAIFVEQEEVITEEILLLAKKFNIPVEQIVKAQSFDGAINTSLDLIGLDSSDLSNNSNVVHLVLIGQGKREKRSVEQYRRAVGSLVRVCEKYKIKEVAINFPEASHYKVSAEYLARETAIVLDMSSYHFDQFITDESKKHIIPTVTLVLPAIHAAQVEAGLKIGKIIGEGTNLSRYWIDMPPHYMNPNILADIVQKTAKEFNLNCTILDQKKCIELGMGGIEAVSQGSQHDGFLTILEYKSEKKDAPTVAIVGKGVTFDSGGLSIKPAVSMESMKDDMSGAASVIATMRVIAQLKPEINVIGLTPLVENMPSGTAIRPGDIVKFYNGKTAEIKNTDAEGRLILADALSYAVKHYNLTAIIDIATLTGACAYALGGFYAALMSKDENLLESIKKASSVSGERVWELPLDDDYKAAIKSTVADLCNIGSNKYMAGTITAAFFLSNFVDDVPWAHLDIAGAAFNVPDVSYYRSGIGASGYGVRLFTDLIMNWKK